MYLLYAALLAFGLLSSTGDALYRLYETMQNENNTSMSTFDCLYTLRIRKEWAIPPNRQHYSSSYENVRICRRTLPTTTKSTGISSYSDTTEGNNQMFTLNNLRQMNVTPEQLFDWYAPLDTIEEYILGNNQVLFFNCSQDPYVSFGATCQYTFDSADDLFNIIKTRLSAKLKYQNDVLSFTNGSCYPMNDADCHSVLCLDWREICDGKIDCTNGFDERRCDELEMNECDNETEFRCLNGQCIDKMLFQDSYPACMDASNKEEDVLFSTQCYYKYDTRCEDLSCPLTWFSCGDGYCYDGPSIQSRISCSSQRDRLYFEQMPQSTLVLFSHIFLIYNNMKPEWICYNRSLCPYLSTNEKTINNTLSVNDSICRAYNTFSNKTYTNLYDMVKYVKSLVRSCSLLSRNVANEKCSRFRCADQSKCLSYHRLFDGYPDCSKGEDEYQTNTCSLNLPYRYSCDNSTKCIRRSLINDKISHCFDGSDESYEIFRTCVELSSDSCSPHKHQSFSSNISFSQLCNGVLERIHGPDNNTDESNCSVNEWPCLTRYTKCNNIWNCPNGEDELGCEDGTQLAKRHCAANEHFCLNISTGLPGCLSLLRAGDGSIDCVGSTDEREFCRTKYPDDFTRRYRCHNSDLCISPFDVCNCHQDCPNNDDETIACLWLNNGQEPFCNRTHFRCRSGKYLDAKTRCDRSAFQCPDGEDEFFCEVIDLALSRDISTINMEEYPNAIIDRRKRNSFTPSAFTAWYCNRGIYVRSTESSVGFYCFCLDFYYGDRCQFQRKRVSLLLRLTMTSTYDRFLRTAKIVTLLVRENAKTQIVLSHDHIVYVPERGCGVTYYAQLLYPINESSSISFNHSVHVYMFIAQTLQHQITWIFPIPFDFLPVTRIAKRLFIPDPAIPTTVPLIIIQNTSCTACSNDGLCLGYDTDLNRDICICRLGRIGRRCLISFNPCKQDSCHGHGKCIPADERSKKGSQFACLCDSGWMDEYCNKSTARIHISFAQNVNIPSTNIALIHIIDVVLNPIRKTYLHRFQQDTSNFTFFVSQQVLLRDLAFIQLYERHDRYNYYLLYLRKDNNFRISEISTEVSSSTRCYSTEELFDNNIVTLPRLSRVKYYQQPCMRQDSREKLRCFYDDQFMCLCDETNHTDCFDFRVTFFGCSSSRCSEQGLCVQDDDYCPIRSMCLCKPCSYGLMCQFSSNGYALSLDSILGSHIHRVSLNILQHTSVIQISTIIVSVLVVIGIILNTLAIGTFSQKTAWKVGCGIYLFFSSFIGFLTMVMLLLKMLLMIGIQPQSTSCSMVEFLLKWLLTSTEWLNAFVAIERTLAIIHQTRYSQLQSQRRAKWIIPSIVLSTALACVPELLYRRAVLDIQDDRTWCVLTLNSERRAFYLFYSISNLFLFLAPLVINLVSGIFIIVSTSLMKEKLFALNDKQIQRMKNECNSTVTHNKNKIVSLNRLVILKEQIKKYKHILIGPVLLDVLSTPRIVFSFLFTCTKLDQKPFLSLCAYLVAFFPSMAILFAFVLPSQTYRQALSSFIKQVVPSRVKNWFHACYSRS